MSEQTETIFDIEKSVQKVKNKVVEKIINTNIIEKTDDFIAFSKFYKSLKLLSHLMKKD